MKKATLFSIMTILALVFAMPGCGSSGKSSSSSSTPATGTGTSNVTGDIPSAADLLAATDPAAMASDNHVVQVSSIDEMFQWLNKCRQDYSSHGRNPADGAGWAITFSWDDGLAQHAQDRAEELAAGSGPQGSRKVYMLSSMHPGEDIFLTDGSTCKIEALSRPESAANASTGGASGKWHDKGNSAYRMYFCYYDGTGAKMTKLGVGAAKTSDGGVWWVLQFGR
ncbi:MAG: CAP domain-containing protein [Planctomycetota bacterium]